jgi:chromosomal replication initiator protein
MEIDSTLRLALIDKIGQERFELWFVDTHLSLANNTLTVAVPSRFKLDWLRSNFRTQLDQAAADLFGDETRVEFRIDTSLAKQATKESTGTRESSSSESQPTRPTTAEPPRRNGKELSTFVASEGNRVAVTAAEMVLHSPGEVNPLFVHGSHGVGKTHLLEGIAAAMRGGNRSSRAVCLTAEQFTSSFLEALHGRGLPSFRNKYRGVSLLVIDDVQFFLGKQATQTELKHTIDVLLRENRQLVFSADRPPNELGELGPELVARLSSGLVCRITPPEASARREILFQMAERIGVKLPKNVATWVSAQLHGDARLLSGALNRLWATSTAMNRPIDRAMAEEALAELIRAGRRPVGLADIEKAVCDVFGLESRTLQSDRKAKSVTYPRMLAMWLARKHTRAALSEISQYFGRRSHSTVISAERKVSNWMTDDKPLAVAGRPWQVEDAIGQIERRLQVG